MENFMTKVERNQDIQIEDLLVVIGYVLNLLIVVKGDNAGVTPGNTAKINEEIKNSSCFVNNEMLLMTENL